MSETQGRGALTGAQLLLEDAWEAAVISTCEETQKDPPFWYTTPGSPHPSPASLRSGPKPSHPSVPPGQSLLS